MSRISIIVPVHNTEKYLEDTVRSIFEQKVKDVEIILVENGSTDGSLALCHKIAETDERIKVMHLDRGDLAYARNSGLTLATSEYVAFLDSDDTVKPEMYEILLGIAEEHDLDMVYCNFVKKYDDLIDMYNYTEDGSITIMTPKEMLIRNFTQRINVNACTMISRRKLYDHLKFPENMYYEDRAFTFRLVNASSKVGYINKPLYNYYQRKDSIIHSRSWKWYYDYAESDRLRLEFINNSDLFTPKEKTYLCEISAVSMLRKLRHVRKKAKTPEQKQKFLEMARSISLIPADCKLTAKTKLIRKIINSFYLK